MIAIVVSVVLLSVLVLIAGMFLLAKTQKENLGKMYSVVSYGAISLSILVMVFAIGAGTVRCCMKHCMKDKCKSECGMRDCDGGSCKKSCSSACSKGEDQCSMKTGSCKGGEMQCKMGGGSCCMKGGPGMQGFMFEKMIDISDTGKVKKVEIKVDGK